MRGRRDRRDRQAKIAPGVLRRRGTCTEWLVTACAAAALALFRGEGVGQLDQIVDDGGLAGVVGAQGALHILRSVCALRVRVTVDVLVAHSGGHEAH